RHVFGSNWRAPRDLDDLKSNPLYCQLLDSFVDAPGPNHVFSVHNMVQIGMSYDKLPGEWYGPTTVAYILRDLALLHRRQQQDVEEEAHALQPVGGE
ncbi:cysteine protease family, partial [Nannochloropsis gaditana CCMP526]|uniref:cysteine protease family n=2 Tax=Nannochloropsis gaditana (strain CCMP526) TaxID=1093141 RepID=UPI00029F5F8A